VDMEVFFGKLVANIFKMQIEKKFFAFEKS
jgi:hypothetical protein